MTWVLFTKEIKSLFSSWVAYVVLIAFTLLCGLYFNVALQMFEIVTKYSDSAEEGAARQSWSLLEYLINPLYETIFILLFVMVPAITMRLFAEEKKQRTEELLLTSPIRVGEIVLAKYLAALVLIFLMLLPVALFPAITIYYGKPAPDWGAMVAGYAGLFILGVSLAAIGIFASSITENQVVAFVFTVALEMIFFVMAQATVMLDVVRIGDTVINLGSFVRALSITDHFSPMKAGIFRLSDMVYFISLIVFWLWATKKSIESTRW
jgi:ABC-2 type transport system permease protein